MNSEIEELYNQLSIRINNSMQDLDIECADASRIEEFCDFYESKFFSVEQKKELMKLLIASYDEGLHEKSFNFDWKRIEILLNSDYKLHIETIEYWSLLEENNESNIFAVTPLVRGVWRKFNNEN